MKSELDSIEFIFTDEMAKEMININKIKKLLINKKIEYKYLVNNKKDCKKVKKEMDKLNYCLEKAKKRFIDNFQNSNLEQIKIYLDIMERQEK